MNPPDASVHVRGIAAGGDGIASLADGRTVFVPRAAAGDRLRLRNVRLHARFARAEIAEIIEASPDRVAAPCPHYVADRCGGCQLMHIAPAAQRLAKARIAGDALRRLAHLDMADPEILESPVEVGYRTKVTFAVRKGRIGYHPVGDAIAVFDVRECLLAEPAVRALHAAVRAARALLPADASSLVLRRDRVGGLHLLVRTAGGMAWSGGEKLHSALHREGIVATIWWHPEDGAARVVAGADGPWPVTVFEQVHPAMGRTVREAALSALGPLDGLHVWDLYAGMGDTTVGLLAGGATAESVESDPRAVALAEMIGPPASARHAGRVEDVLARLRPPDAVITNPPRAGVAMAVIDGLVRSSARVIAYISCDPATLARDVARLAPAFRMREIRAFDQFPQTAHVECLAVLERP